MYVRPPADELMHYGVKGMKWGVRRDRKRGNRISKVVESPGYKKVVGAFVSTPAGKAAAKIGSIGLNKSQKKQIAREAKQIKARETARKQQKSKTNSKVKTALKVGAAVAAAGLAVYGGYKFSRFVKNSNVAYHEQIGRDIVDKMRPNVARRKGVLLKELSDQEARYNRNAAKSAQYTVRKAAGQIRPGVEDSHGKMAKMNKANMEKLSRQYDEFSGRVNAAYENVIDRERSKALLDTPIDQLVNAYRYTRGKRR